MKGREYGLGDRCEGYGVVRSILGWWHWNGMKDVGLGKDYSWVWDVMKEVYYNLNRQII